MKVYIDELPEKCSKCKFCTSDYYCTLIHKDIFDYDKIINKQTRYSKCPLKLLSDYTKQVRKEVVRDIKDYMENHNHTIPVDTKNRKVVYKIGLTRFLDKIQGE